MLRKITSAILVMGLIAVPAAAEIEISGYVDVSYYDIQGSGQAGVLPAAPPAAGSGTTNGNQVNPALQGAGTTNGQTNNNGTFDVAEVDLYITAPLTENITAYAELNSTSLGAVEVPEAYIEFMNPFGFEAINVNVGYFPAVFGISGSQCAPPDRRNISQPLLAAYSAGDVLGIQAFGEPAPWLNYSVSWANSDPAGGGSITNTDNGAGNAPGATIGNGLTSGAAPEDVYIATLARGGGGGLTRDNNTNKTILGRVGFTPIGMIEIGLSGSTGHYLEAEQDRVMWGIDATFRYQPLRVSFEYLDVTEEIRQTDAGATPFCDAEAKSWYVEAELDIPIETKILPNRKTLFLRYEEIKFSGPQTLGTGAGSNNTRITYFEGSSITLAAAYDLFDNLTWKAEYQWNDEDQSGPVRGNAIRSDMGDVENDVFAMSLVATY